MKPSKPLPAEKPEFKSPVRKLLEVFRTGRDTWKAKYQRLKAEIKLMENQVRAVEKSREQWRARSRAAEERIKELEIRLDAVRPTQGLHGGVPPVEKKQMT
jgi:hypothetical protein